MVAGVELLVSTLRNPGTIEQKSKVIIVDLKNADNKPAKNIIGIVKRTESKTKTEELEN